MKITHLFLACCLAAVLPAGLSAADNAADAQAKAKAAAEAKAKAERIRGISTRHSEIARQLHAAYEAKDAAKQTELLKALFDNAAQADTPANIFADAERQIMNNLHRNKAMQKERFLLYYPKFIVAASGDTKADLTCKYADTAEKAKWMTAEEAQKLRLSALQLKDLSPMCRFRMNVNINDLKTADEAVPAILAAQKDDKAKNNALNTILNAFKAKKVFGSDYTDKYYRMWVDAAPTADEKAARMGAYGDFMLEYCMRPDEEIQKYLDSRYALNGLTPVGRVNCYVRDLHKIHGDSGLFKTTFEKAYSEVKSDAKARAALYRGALTGFNWQHTPPLCYAELVEKYAIPDKENGGCVTLGTYAGQLTNRVEATGKMLNKLYVGALQDLVPFQKASLEALKAWKQAEADYTAKIEAANALNQKLKEIKDAKAREPVNAELVKANKAANDARTVMNDKRKAFDESRNARRPVLDRYYSCCNALISYYNSISSRYYDTPNPFCKQKIADLQRENLMLEAQLGDEWRNCNTTCSMIQNLYAAENVAEMNKAIAELEKLSQSIDPKKEQRRCNTVTNFLFRAKIYQALQAYKDENYEQALVLLKPYIESKDHQLRAMALEPYVRSFAALGREEEALPYLDDWVKATPWWTRNKEQAAQLKARIEAKAKAEK